MLRHDHHRLRMPRPARHAMATAFGDIDAGTTANVGELSILLVSA
jgi:hypothetical protein